MPMYKITTKGQDDPILIWSDRMVEAKGFDHVEFPVNIGNWFPRTAIPRSIIEKIERVIDLSPDSSVPDRCVELTRWRKEAAADMRRSNDNHL